MEEEQNRETETLGSWKRSFASINGQPKPAARDISGQHY